MSDLSKTLPWYLALLLTLTLKATTLTAQSFVVESEEAIFRDAIDGTEIGRVPQGTPLYGLKRENGWVQAIDPKTLQPGWVSWNQHLKLVLDDDARRRRGELVEQETDILQFGIETAVTGEQLNQAVAWAEELEKVSGAVHPVPRAAYLTAATIAERAGVVSVQEKCLLRGLEISQRVYGKQGELTAEIELQLAHHFVAQSEMTRGLQFAKSAFITLAGIHGAEHPSAAVCWLPAGDAMYLTGNFEDAIGFYRNAEQSFARVLGDADTATLDVRTSLANSWQALGETEQAIALHEKNQAALRSLDFDSLSEVERPQFRDQLLKTDLRLMLLQTDPADRDALSDLRQQISQAATVSPELAPFLQGLEDDLVSRLLADGSAASRKQAFEFMDQGLKHLRQSLRRDLWSVPAERQADYLSFHGGTQFFRSLSLAIDFEANPEIRKTSLEWLINAKGLIRETRAMQAGAVTDLEKRTQFVERPFVSFDEVRQALPEDGVYVDIIRYQDFDFRKPAAEPVEKYAAWIAGKTGDVEIIELGEVKAIDQMVISLKARLLETAPKAIRNEIGAWEDVQPELEKVSRQLWEPLRSRFGDARVVVLSPDQTLWLLPWSAMLGPDGKFAIEDYQVQLELSGRDLIRKKTSGRTTPPVLFADPDFGEAAEPSVATGLRSTGVRITSVEPLKYSSLEARLIARWVRQFLGDPVLYSGQQALEASFKQLDSPSVLVMSTHGFFVDQQGRSSLAGLSPRSAGEDQRQELARNPLLQCGLMLANANQHQSIEKLENDGVLTGAEIAATNLQHTQLAVLSACQTGVGTLQPTSGVIGMQSAFQAAGVRCVISTLWPIPDEQTVDLTNSFFQSLAETRIPRQSLQQAQKQQIEKRRRLNGAAHPFFWAAFSITGEADFR